MPLTKEELIDMVYSELDMPKKEGIQIVESVLEIMQEQLDRGEEVMISGFGKWPVKKKDARNGRNPQTGERITIAISVVTFKSAPRLRSVFNRVS